MSILDEKIHLVGRYLFRSAANDVFIYNEDAHCLIDCPLLEQQKLFYKTHNKHFDRIRQVYPLVIAYKIRNITYP